MTLMPAQTSYVLCSITVIPGIQPVDGFKEAVSLNGNNV